MGNKKMSLKELIEKKKEGVKTFEDVQKESEKLKELTNNPKKVGRKMLGKSYTRHKIAFYVNDEQLDYLYSLVNPREKLNTPSAVAKMLFVRDYELHGKKKT